jgi:class 3 adenylate cyclase
MESHGLPGTIQVTEQTRALLDDVFEFESRGVIDIKGKGLMPMHLLRGRKSGVTQIQAEARIVAG